MRRIIQMVSAGLGLLLAMALVGLTPARVGAVTTDSPAHPLKVVLLGDSYSAGNGARDENGKRDYYGPAGCYRSHSNWAEQYVDYLEAQGYSVSFINRACSGAITEDVLSGQTMDTTGGYLSVGDTSSGDLQQVVEKADPCNTGNYPAEEYWTYQVTGVLGASVAYTCTRHLKPQIDAVNADTDLVLFTIGGNDISFGKIVEQCFMPGYRDADSCRSLIDHGESQLGTVQSKVVDIIKAMRARGLRDDARVIIGGYPLLALNNGYSLNGYPVADAVRQLGMDGDATQDQIVADANLDHPGQVIHLRPVPTAFGTHEPDGYFAYENPNQWLNDLFDTRIKMEWFHMNPQGHHQYAQLLENGGTYGAGTDTAAAGQDMDVALVLDTTGSMGSSIDAVRQYATQLVDQVSASTTSARFSLVTYRDQPSWTGDPSDYPSRVELGFTSDGDAVKAALNNVTVNGGGDWPESMYSGVMAGLNLDWRPGVKKVVIVLADAPAHDPEPVTGYTASDVVAKAFAIDPAEVYLVDTGAAGSDSVMKVVSETGGERIDAASSTDVPGAIMAALQTALDKPYAWINGPYVAKVGSTVEIDGSGSYAPQGQLTSYEWDFDGDGAYDQTTTSPVVDHLFTSAYSGTITLRVTDDAGRTALATTHVGITDDGDETPAAEDNCPDVDNQGQEDFDGDGVGDMCDETPGWKMPDKPGVYEGWPFDGFLSPVANPPVGNVVNAGKSVPMKFSLGGDYGLDILAEDSPSSREVDCSSAGSLDDTGSTTDTNSGLHFDETSDTYNYVWATPKSWAGTCRMFTMRLKDGSSHKALFVFK